MTSNPNTSKPSTSAIVLLITLLIGVADSIYLLIAHISSKLGGNVGGLCDISAKLNCNAAISSDHSVILGVPLPVFTLAFFTGLLTLALSAQIRKDNRSKEFIVVLLSGAFAYSFVLLIVMVTQLKVLCPGCLVMDAALLIGLVASAMNAGGVQSMCCENDAHASCTSPPCSNYEDCNGIVNGGAVEDKCGVCGGDSSTCKDC